MMIILFVIIGVVVYLLVGGRFNQNTFHSKSAINQLDERLSKGEISIEEYQKLKDVIEERK